MATRTLWEYRVIAVGTRWGAEGSQIEARLNELGLEGWEVINLLHNRGKVLAATKRPLGPSERRIRREWPSSP